METSHLTHSTGQNKTKLQPGIATWQWRIRAPPSSTQQLSAKQEPKNLSPVRGDALYQPPKHQLVLSFLWG